MTRYDPRITGRLQVLREAQGLSQKEAARYFGMRDRRSVGEWELGITRPHRHRQEQFATYLLDKLRLRRDPQRFITLWQEIMVGEWDWPMLTAETLRAFFPSSFRSLKIDEQRVEIVLRSEPPPERPIFQAPPRAAQPLVGRASLLADIKQRLLPDDGRPAVVALTGLPGAGKTALAVELAHDPDVRAAFPDGVLWARLGSEADLLSVLVAWGAALDLPEWATADLEDVDSWSRAIHEALGLRRLLLVADDAWDPILGMALRLGGPYCGYLLTTRLPETAIHVAGPNVLQVPELDVKHSLALLELLAPSVAATQPAEMAQLVDALGGLPLGLLLAGSSLRIAGLHGGPDRIASLLQRLRQVEGERLRLSRPQGGVDRHPSLPERSSLSLEAIIQVSVERLSEPARGAFYDLACFPTKPHTFSREAARFVAQAGDGIVEQLVQAGLLEPNGAERLAMHQTIGDFGRLPGKRPQAAARYFYFFGDYARRHTPHDEPLTAEMANLQAAVKTGLELGALSEAAALIDLLFPVLLSRGQLDLLEGLLQQALDRARADGTDPPAVLFALFAELTDRRGRPAAAHEWLRQGIEAARRAECEDLEALALLFKVQGSVFLEEGFPDQAEASFHTGLQYAMRAESNGRILSLLKNIGILAFERGRHAEAAAVFQQALELAQADGDERQMAACQMNLALAHDMQERFEEAAVLYEAALSTARQLGLHSLQGKILLNVGAMWVYRGEYGEAADYFEEGLALARELEDRRDQSQLLMNLGVVYQCLGDDSRAENHYLDALALRREIDFRRDLPQLLCNLGVLCLRQDRHDQAYAYLVEAREIAARTEEILHNGRAHAYLGLLATLREEWPAAEEALARAAEIAAEAASEDLRQLVALHRGELYLRRIDGTQAAAAFAEGAELADRIGLRRELGLARYGQARAALLLQRRAEAERYGREAAAVFERLGYREAQQVFDWLAAAGFPRNNG